MAFLRLRTENKMLVLVFIKEDDIKRLKLQYCDNMIKCTTCFFFARFQVHMLNFLQYILQLPTESLLYRMYTVQQKNPTKGNWVSSVTKLVEHYDIKLTMKEIKDMARSHFEKTNGEAGLHQTNKNVVRKVKA